MTDTVLSIRDIPGPRFRRTLRRAMLAGRPWTLIVDTRTAPPPSLDRLAMLLRLSRRARTRRGHVIVVVNEALHNRLHDTGLDRWLCLTHTVDEARGGVNSGPRRREIMRTGPL